MKKILAVVFVLLAAACGQLPVEKVCAPGEVDGNCKPADAGLGVGSDSQ